MIAVQVGLKVQHDFVLSFALCALLFIPVRPVSRDASDGIYLRHVATGPVSSSVKVVGLISGFDLG
jgi:hypothetical protein